MGPRGKVAGLLLVLAAVLVLATGAPDPDPHAGRSEITCVRCHAADAPARWAAHRDEACTPWCLTCHGKAEMDEHHPVGTVLRKHPGAAFPLTEDGRMACFTCHLLSRPRYDTVRWKASSLFDRLFRSEPRYKTYYLTERNDQGQLCLACH
jgi:hypothetical protein